MLDDEVKATTTAIISEIGAPGMKDMGKATSRCPHRPRYERRNVTGMSCHLNPAAKICRQVVRGLTADDDRSRPSYRLAIYRAEVRFTSQFFQLTKQMLGHVAPIKLLGTT